MLCFNISFSFIFFFFCVQVWVVSGELSGNCGARRAFSPRTWATLEDTRPTPRTRRSALVCMHQAWCVYGSVANPQHQSQHASSHQAHLGCVFESSEKRKNSDADKNKKNTAVHFLFTLHASRPHQTQQLEIVQTGSQWCENMVNCSRISWFSL